MDELKHCPFCGGIGPRANEDGDWTVTCNVCDARSGCALTQKIAKHLWNTRPIEDAQAAEIARLKAALAQIAGCQSGHRVDVVGLARAALGINP